ncbi:MAG TPA: hypothetical protein VFV01_29325 [Spirillospora sp.]|nr:hypothetical protein [Spirillospora sp.]
MPNRETLAIRAYKLGCLAGEQPNNRKVRRRALVAMKELLAATTEDDLRILAALTGESLATMRKTHQESIQAIDAELVAL